ncbi:MAG: carboxyltransferase domain-containing protein [Polyangiaceae bacterium]|nr:carboxyltransferase domain-containing protein [Polyangiaceae bacterium]
MRLLPFGESAWLVELETQAPSERADRTLAAAEALREALPHADVVVGAGTVLVAAAFARALGDALATPVRRPDAATITVALERASRRPPRHLATRPAHELPVVYDGPDLAELAAHLGGSPAEAVRLHAAPTYRVELLGFLPGFAYLGGLDPALRLPRRPSPRPRVAPGSVGIAGEHSGIYPFASPGGWTLLGRSVGAGLFDPRRYPPGLLQPGDAVRFLPLRADEAPPPNVAAGPTTNVAARPTTNVAAGLTTNVATGPTSTTPAGPTTAAPSRGLCVLRAPPGTSIQDAGRVGHLHAGLSPSGPIDIEVYEAANRALGNAPDAAALELPFGSCSLRAIGTQRVSIDGEAPRTLRDGETLDLPAHARAFRYLAVAGGVDVPLLLGARATLAVARLGGLDGRFLRPGDVIAAGSTPTPAPEAPALARFDPPDLVTLHVDPGPHRDRFPPEAWARLLETTWTLSRLVDRVGARLEGPALPREGSDLTLPCPMVRGAMQIARDGRPIVLGPDHPTTGGYPVLAVVRRASLSRLGRLRPGHAIRFDH